MKSHNTLHTLKRTGEVAGVAAAALALSVLGANSAEALTNNDMEKNPSLLYGALYGAVDASSVAKTVVKSGHNVKESASYPSLDGDVIRVNITHPKDARGEHNEGTIKVEEYDVQTGKFESGLYVTSDGTKVFVVAVEATKNGNNIVTNIGGAEAGVYPRDDLAELARISGNLLSGVQSVN